MKPIEGPKNPFGQQFLDQNKLAPGMEKWREQFNNFFPGQGLTPKQFMKFVQGIENMINAQIRQEEQSMKKANQKLKEAETGND